MITLYLVTGILDDMLFTVLPAVGFAMVFNVPKVALFYCALCGIIGHGSRYFMMYFGFPIEVASFFAASIVSMFGIHWSHKLLAHPKVFTIASLIPMIPGSFAFKAMIALVELNHQGFDPQLLDTLVTNFLKALFIIAGFAVGLALPGLLFYRRRSIV